MKGIIMAAGSGSRLHPMTLYVSKHLLPVYDRPMIYFPLATLMAAGVREILVIVRPEDQQAYRRVVGDGSQWGIRIAVAPQPQASGIADGLVLGRSFVGEDRVCLILGDNLFVGEAFVARLARLSRETSGTMLFGNRVTNPSPFGVGVFDGDDQLIDIEEKPAMPRSDVAIVGLYVYDSSAYEIAKNLPMSARQEREITTLNRHYIDGGGASFELLPPSTLWRDLGTADALLDASILIRSNLRAGLAVPRTPDDVARENGWIDPEIRG